MRATRLRGRSLHTWNVASTDAQTLAIGGHFRSLDVQMTVIHCLMDTRTDGMLWVSLSNGCRISHIEVTILSDSFIICQNQGWSDSGISVGRGTIAAGDIIHASEFVDVHAKACAIN